MKFLNLFFLLLISLNIFGQKNVINSNSSRVKYIIEKNEKLWRIDSQIENDILKIYCDDTIPQKVKFITDIDSATFFINEGDTITFSFNLKNQNLCKTQLIGLKVVPNSISYEEKIYYLSLLWSEVKYNFVNIDKINFDIDSLYKSCLSEINKTNNDYEYYQLLKKFLASFNDGHTEVYDGNQFSIFRDYIGVAFKYIKDKIIISLINKNTGLDSSLIGAELIEVNGVNITKYLEDSIFPYVSASTKQHKLMQAVYKLHSNFSTLRFKGKVVKQNTADTVILELPYNGEKIRTNKDEYYGFIEQYDGLFSSKWLQDSIYYISLNSFREEVIGLFNDILPQAYKSKALIIDLRKNGGGSTSTGWHIQKYLTKDNFFLNFAWETRINNGVKKANGNWIDEYTDFYKEKALAYNQPDTIWISDSIKRFEIPIVILIGGYTFSAAEDFLVNLYEMEERPLLIGEETGGSTGSPLVIQNLPGGGYARICTKRIKFPYSKKAFVNQGIYPDIFVKETIDDYLMGKDTVLNKAINVIKNQL